jgi:predicted nucleic acid-binding protein
VRYWDASALVTLLAAQPSSAAALAALEDDPQVITWWGTRVECVSALARIDREGPRDPQGSAALARLDEVSATWLEVAPTARLRRIAERMLRVHPLRTGDALQLAAAVVAADGTPTTLPFVTLDERLARAAEREGFPVIEPVIEPA